MKKLSILISLVVTLAPMYSIAASDADIDRLTSYSVIFGRAAACGIDTDSEIRAVGKWVDRVFPPGSSDQKTYLPIFVSGMRYHAEQQATGQSPDSCSNVRSTVKRMNF